MAERRTAFVVDRDPVATGERARAHLVETSSDRGAPIGARERPERCGGRRLVRHFSG